MIVALAGCGMLFAFYKDFTSNTGNILAWGFHGLQSLGDAGIPLFVYEFVHSTSAYGDFLTGLWLVGASAIVLNICRVISRLHATRVVATIWAVGFVSFIIGNGILFCHPDINHVSQYFKMIVTDPFADEVDIGVSPLRYWLYIIPAVTAVSLLNFKSYRNLSGCWLALFLTLPLLAAPEAQANYRSYHFLCFLNPDVYEEFLWRLTSYLAYAPAAAYIVLTAIGFCMKTRANKAALANRCS